MNKIFNKISKEQYLQIISLIIFGFVASIFIITPLLSTSMNFKNYRGGEIVSSTSILSMYKNPSMSLKFLVNNPHKLKTLIFTDLLLSILTIIAVFLLKNLYPSDSTIKYKEKDGTHGTARWMKESETETIVKVGNKEQPILQVGRKEPGVSYGQIPSTNNKVKLPFNSFIYNKNVAIFGGPGSGKSRTYVRNNVFELVQAKQSIIFTDPKGELFRDLFVYLKEQHYNVKVLNLVNLLNSDRWNPLTEVTDDLSAQLFTEVVMANTSPPGQKGDQFWEKGEQNLLKALVLYVINEFPEEDRNLSNLYNLISHTDAAQLDRMFKMLPNTHSAKAPYNIFCQASETVRTGIIIGLGTRLQIIQNRKVQELTATSEIDLSAPGKEPCAYFCITSDTNSTFDFLSGLFFSFLFINLINYADLHDGQCIPNVHCLLDEFPNIAAIPDFTKKISTMRSRGVHTHVIFQNVGQLQNRYPNNAWSEILGSCDSKLFLGCTDLLTAEYVSKVLGTATVEDVSNSKAAGFEGLFDIGKDTYKGTKRNLLNPDEVLAYPNAKSILMLKGQKPLQLEKVDFTNYPQSKDLKVIQISDYNPQWAIDFMEKSKNKHNNILEKKEDKEDTTKEETPATIIQEKKTTQPKKTNQNKKEDTKKEKKVEQIKVDNFFNSFQ